MAYGQNQNRQNYNNSKPAQARAAAPQQTAQVRGEFKDESILRKLMRPSKSGKSVATFSVGEKDIILPANTVVVITALTPARMESLEKASKAKGYTTSTPTHELSVFPIVDKK